MANKNPKIVFLEQYREAEKRSYDRMEQLIRIRQRLLPGASNITGMPTGGKKHDISDGISIIVDDLEKQVLDEIESFRNVRNSVLKAINTAGDTKQRTILEKRYISGKTWKKIAVEMECDQTTIWRIHGEALKSIHI